MRVLIVCAFFPPTHTAGSEQRAYGYATELLQMGHEVQVICAGAWDQGQSYWNGYTDEIYDGIPVRRIHVNWALASDPNQFLYYNPFLADHLQKWLVEWKPDVAHIISCYTLSASVFKVVKAHNIPIVLTLTDYWFLCPKVNLLHANGSLCDGRTTEWECLSCLLWDAKAYRWPMAFLPEHRVKPMLQWVSQHPYVSRRRGLRGMALNMQNRKDFLQNTLKLADVIIAPSQCMRDIFISAGMPGSIQVIRSGHDLRWTASMPVRQPSKVLRLGFIGQINLTKGVHTLISAFVAASLGDRARLDIYGNCEQAPAYTQQLRRLIQGREHIVTFQGSFERARLGEVLSTLDVLVVPSIWHENNPRVIQEAFAAKIPVIASDVDGISEFVTHEKNGLLFSRDNIEDLRKNLRRLLDEPELLAQLRVGIPPVKSMEQEVTELLGVYHRLL
jgi:glycosyltransferase involved in cell wall biosynthesis